VEVRALLFSTSGLDEGEWLASSLGRFYPREIAAGTHWKGGWDFYPMNIIYKEVKVKLSL
jgi:hypothetical protein